MGHFLPLLKWAVQLERKQNLAWALSSGSQPFWACGTLILKTSLAAHLIVKRDQKDENVAVFAFFLWHFKIVRHT